MVAITVAGIGGAGALRRGRLVRSKGGGGRPGEVCKDTSGVMLVVFNRLISIDINLSVGVRCILYGDMLTIFLYDTSRRV